MEWVKQFITIKWTYVPRCNEGENHIIGINSYRVIHYICIVGIKIQGIITAPKIIVHFAPKVGKTKMNDMHYV